MTVPPVILVVEDNPATRKIVRFTLERRGYRILEAPDGATAVRLMTEHRPRVVLQDLLLPDVDGFELVARLRACPGGSEAAILAFSGFVSRFEEGRIAAVGFDDVISKPIEPSRLLLVVESHLGGGGPTPDRLGGGRRVVLCDDDPLQLKLTRLRLAKFGFDVEIAGDGEEALARARANPPDIIVADVLMPKLDGFGLALAVRQEPALHDTPILLVTSSYIEDSDRDLARRAGAVDLVLRTPELQQVITALRGVFEGPVATQRVHPDALPELERERSRRVLKQLERQVQINTGLLRRCSSLAAELTILTGISEAVLRHRDVDVALEEALAACFDAGGISVGALYLIGQDGALRARKLGGETAWGPGELASFFGHESILRGIIATGAPTSLPSASAAKSDPGIRRFLERCGASHALVVPLVHLDRPLGALFMVARGTEVDQEDWRTFALGVGNQITQVVALTLAFAEKEEAERAALESRAQWQALVEHAPDVVMRIDPSGTIDFVNRPFAGWTPAELLGSSWLVTAPREQHVMLADTLASVIATGRHATWEMPAPGAEGPTPWYSSNLGPIRREDRNIGAVLVARDITQRKSTEAQLIVADRMASVGTLAAGVAHEINNPLASVIANLDVALREVMETDLPMPDELADSLRDAREASERVRQIVRDLKIFSRTEEERRGAVDVHRVLESTMRMAWNEIRHRARLVKEYGKIPAVEASESRLGQVFLNLVVNAAQSIEEGNADLHEIRVKTSVDEKGRVVVTVADTGSGIPEEVRARLFTPFFTTKPVGVGTGLGLSICHRIVTSVGGEITFTSEVGKGTEFRVVLPAALNDRPSETRPGRQTLLPVRRARVLVIDDEPMVTHAIRRALTPEHEVSVSHSAEEALHSIADGKRYDVILCDLMMPQMTGMDLHARLLEQVPEQAARMVFLTGGAFTPRGRDFLDEVTNHRMEKPFDRQGLRALVADFVRT